MQLSIVLALVLAGIVALVVLLQVTGRRRTQVLSAQEAHAEWTRHFPDDAIGGLHLTHDGHAALVRTEQGPGLLWTAGAGTVARRLRDFDLIDTPHGLDVAFHDGTAASVHLRLDASERGQWRQWMRAV